MTHETFDTASVASEELRQFVERVETAQQEIDAANEVKKDIFSEAKARGFDVPALKEIIKIRRRDPAERQEREAIVELYMQHLGMI